MKEIALTLPGLTGTVAPLVKTGAGQVIPSADLGGVISATLDIVFLIASVLMFVWMVWGIFQYIFAGGEKEKLAKARSRITWAIIGFCITLLAYTIYQYAKEIFPTNPNTQLKQVSEPPETPR